MDHSLPSPRCTQGYSLEQSLYSPCSAMMKPPPEYETIQSTSSYDPNQYMNPASVSSLQSEDNSYTINRLMTPPPPLVQPNQDLNQSGNAIPSFTQLLQQGDEEGSCGFAYQPVSNDVGTFATLTTVNPMNSIHDVIHQRGDQMLPVQSLNIVPHGGFNNNIYDNSKPCEDFDKCGGALSDVPLSLSQSENLDLALATIKAEAEGTQTAVVKEELKYKIRRKRSISGLGEIKQEEDDNSNKGLTKADIDRKERRKASNRKAAAKCRQKKIKEQLTLVKAKEDSAARIEALEQENLRLKELLSHCTCPAKLKQGYQVLSQATSSSQVPSQNAQRKVARNMTMNELEAYRGSQGYDDNQYSSDDEELIDEEILHMNGTGQVRAELRDRIHRKRKQAGLDYIVIEPKMQMREHLTSVDVEKRERRKASNRNAARRCREKKVQAHQNLVKDKNAADSRIREVTEQNAHMAADYRRLAEENQQLYNLLAKCTCQKLPHSFLRNKPHSLVPKPSKPVTLPQRPPPPPPIPIPVRCLSRENSIEADSGIAVSSTSPSPARGAPSPARGAPSPARAALLSSSPPKEEGKIELTVSAYDRSKHLKLEDEMMTPDSSQEERSGSPLDLSQGSRSVLDLSQPNDDVLDLRKQ